MPDFATWSEALASHQIHVKGEETFSTQSFNRRLLGRQSFRTLVEWETLHHCAIEGDGVAASHLHDLFEMIWDEYDFLSQIESEWLVETLGEMVDAFGHESNVPKHFYLNMLINVGYAQAREWSYNLSHVASHVTLDEVQNLHKILFTPVFDLGGVPVHEHNWRPGVFRSEQCPVNIVPFRGNNPARDPSRWEDVLFDLGNWVRSCEVKFDAVEDLNTFFDFIAFSHSEFEIIHPFADGNGRTGRLINNLYADRCGYDPMVVTEGVVQHEYYQGLRAASYGDYSCLKSLCIEAKIPPVFLLPSGLVHKL